MVRLEDATARTLAHATIVLIGVTALAGCAPLATVACCKPAEIDVRGMARIAVMDFGGENGPAVASAVTARLWDNRFYTLVDPAEIAPVQHASLGTTAREECILRQARQAGVDAVVLGEVLEHRCDDRAPADSNLSVNNETVATPDRERIQISFIHRDRIRREATVSVAFRLVDARTGEVRASRTCDRHYHDEIAPGDGAAPARGEVLTELVNACVDEFVEMLAPHQSSCRMRLARGEWPRRGSFEVRAGNQAAITGDWELAREHWRSALERNPHCDSALYNLAVDAAARQEYTEAEDLAMQALRIEHCDLYTTGLAEIRSHRSDFESSREQHDGRILQATASPWDVPEW